jgi:hypothetical protein
VWSAERIARTWINQKPGLLAQAFGRSSRGRMEPVSLVLGAPVADAVLGAGGRTLGAAWIFFSR